MYFITLFDSLNWCMNVVDFADAPYPKIVLPWFIKLVNIYCKSLLFDEIEKTAAQFSDAEKFDNKVIELFDSYLNSRKESFISQLNKLNETVEA